MIVLPYSVAELRGWMFSLYIINISGKQGTTGSEFNQF
jgi:hypothetical protein